MPHANTGSRRPAVAAVVVLLLACLGLAACGGSSSTTSTTGTTSSSANATSTGTGSSTTSTGSTSTSPAGPGGGRFGARFAAIRECLQKNGITLPKRTPGTHGPPPGTSRLGLPKGVTPKQYGAAVKKCGGGVFAGGGGGARRLNNPVFKAALAKYGACLRQNGINVPAPNTSGNGPIFDTKGVNTASPQFKSASTKCRSALVGAFRHPVGAPGAAGAPPAGSAPAGGESSG
jgi:hypothetical protein